jgi:sugar/nucleoside kinase (ribokinase family)
MTLKRYDFIAVGEALVDLISDEIVSSLADAKRFHRFLGGQVTNVAWNVRMLGGQTAMIGCVGDDGFGNFIYQQLALLGIGIDCLCISAEAPTSIAINARQTATPDFIIHRGADSLIVPQEKCLEVIKTSRVVHTSAFALSREPARSTILHYLEIAQQSDCMVTLDPNYHPLIWPDVTDFQSALMEAFQWVDVTKPSLDDCHRLFGPDLSPLAYAERFLHWGVEIVALTMGKQGALLATAEGDLCRIKPGAAVATDVTGAGDAFWAGLLVALLDGYPTDEAACFGQIVAAAKISTVGPVAQMPARADLYEQLEAVKHKLITQLPQDWR